MSMSTFEPERNRLRCDGEGAAYINEARVSMITRGLSQGPRISEREQSITEKYICEVDEGLCDVCVIATEHRLSHL